MKRFIKVVLLSLVVVGLMSGSAFAISNIRNSSGAASTTIATEIIDPAVGFTHNAAAMILFNVDAGAIPVGSDMAVKLTNATFANISALDIYDVATNSVVATLNTSSADGSTATFLVTTALTPGAAYYVSEAPAPGTLVIKINAGATSVGCSIGTGYAGQTNPEAKNNSLYKAQQQFGMTYGMYGEANVIDVEENLLKFSDCCGFVSADKLSVASYYVRGRDSGPDIPVILYADVNVKFTVTGNFAGVASVKITNIGADVDWFTTDDVDLATLTISSDKKSATGVMKLTDLLTKNVFVKFTVDGTTALESRNFSFQAQLVPAGDVKVATTQIDPSATDARLIAGSTWVDAGKQMLFWDISGLQFVAPYIRQDATVTSVIRVENIKGIDSKVWLFVNNAGVWKLVKMSDLLTGAVLVVRGQDLIDAAGALGVTLNGTTGFAVWGVAKGDQGDNKNITVYGSQQMVGGSFRPLPMQVYYPAWYE